MGTNEQVTGRVVTYHIRKQLLRLLSISPKVGSWLERPGKGKGGRGEGGRGREGGREGGGEGEVGGRERELET